MNIPAMSTAAILKAIRTLQEVQSQNRPTSKEWQEASVLLNELFAEMNQRDPKGEYAATLL